MARFYKNVRIGSFYLTDTGLIGGTSCALEVVGVEDLDVSIVGVGYPAASGKAKFQMSNWVQGKEFELHVNILLSVLYEDLRDDANAKLALMFANQEDPAALFVVAGEGDSGDFTVSAAWNPAKPYSCASFINGRIKQAVFRFVTKGVI